MSIFERVLYVGDTELEHYQVIDMIYDGRPARLLFSGSRKAAQSGIALDDNPNMVFDYNQRLIELALGAKPTRILIIGGGVYTLPSRLLNIDPEVLIDAIEIDPGLDVIAEKYFDHKPDSRLNIIHDDGRHFIDHNKIKYDMIIIDAFIHAVMPRQLSTVQAVMQLHSNLNSNGLVAVNIISTYKGRESVALRVQSAAYQAVFDLVELFPADNKFSDWQSQNFILTAQKGKTSPLHYMRFQSKPLLKTQFSETLLDR